MSDMTGEEIGKAIGEVLGAAIKPVADELEKAQARIEELEWLVEVMDLYGETWEKMKERWTNDQEDFALDELYTSLESARAAASGAGDAK